MVISDMAIGINLSYKDFKKDFGETKYKKLYFKKKLLIKLKKVLQLLKIYIIITSI